MVLHWRKLPLAKYLFHIRYDPEIPPLYSRTAIFLLYFLVLYLIIAFLFLDMATLTILYSILFFFLRRQTKRLLKAGGTENRTENRTEDLTTATNNQWEVRFGPEDDLEAPPARPSGPVIVTKSVSVYTESQATTKPHTNARRTYDQINTVSTTLLIYPILYMILTLPISISRISEFRGQELGLTFAYFGAALFECTGFINVLLYTSTRKGLVSWNRLKFWKKDSEKPLNERSERWTVRNAPGAEMVTFDSGRRPSKTSTCSIAALKEELSMGAGVKTREVESDAESHESHR